MLPKERIFAALEHREPDRIPWGEHFIDWSDRITPTVTLGGAAGAAALYFLVSRFRAVQVPFEIGEHVATALALSQRSGPWSREQIRAVIAFCVTRSYEIAEVNADTPLPG